MTLQCVWKLGLTGNAIIVLTGGVTSPTENGMDGEFARLLVWPLAIATSTEIEPKVLSKGREGWVCMKRGGGRR